MLSCWSLPGEVYANFANRLILIITDINWKRWCTCVVENMVYGDVNWKSWCCNMMILIIRRHSLEKLVLLSLPICWSLLYGDINWKRWCCWSLPICWSLLYGDINWKRWCCYLCQYAESILYGDINWERWCCCLCQYADPYCTETLTGKGGVAVFANMLILIKRRH